MEDVFISSGEPAAQLPASGQPAPGPWPMCSQQNCQGRSEFGEGAPAPDTSIHYFPGVTPSGIPTPHVTDTRVLRQKKYFAPGGPAPAWDVLSPTDRLSMGHLCGPHTCLRLQDTSTPPARKACPSCARRGGWLSRPEVPAPHPLRVQSHWPATRPGQQPLSSALKASGGEFWRSVLWR